MFSIVTGVELVVVHNPVDLFEACRYAGIDESEVMIGMVSRISDRKLCLMSETTKRIPKARKARMSSKTINNRPPEGRILQLANAYAAIWAAFDDRKDSDYSPLDD